MRMVDAQRKFLCGDVVAQSQVQLKRVVHHARNRRDGVVRFSICFGKDEGGLVGVSAPAGENVITQCNQSLFIRGANANHGQRPMHNADFHTLHNRRWCSAPQSVRMPWQTDNGRPESGHGSKWNRPQSAGRRWSR